MLGIATIGVQACDGGGDRIIEAPPAPAPPSQSTGTFTLSATPTVSVLRGGGGESKIAIVRSGGFTGSVALAVTGAPAGLTATIDPNSITSTTATLVVASSSSVAANTATLTFTGTAAGRTVQTATTTVAITPNTGGTGNVTVDFSSCLAGSKPIWFAFQDGTGAWTQILGSADVYRFNVASAKGGYAWVGAASLGATVSLATQAELAAATILPCGAMPVLKTMSGTLTGLSTGDIVYVGIGGGITDPDQGPVVTPSFTLTGIMDGIQDLIAYRANPRAIVTNERVIIRRDQNIPNNGTLAPIDFGAAESFAPSTATLTVTGDGSESSSHSMMYSAAAGCMESSLYDDPSIGANFTMRGIPAGQQRTTDFHQVVAYPASRDRFVYESFHALANRVVALPAPLTAPTITTPAGGHKRIQAALTLPPEYQKWVWLFYREQAKGGWGADMHATYAWLGGTTATLTLPDFSQVTGWRSSFLPTPEASVGWWLFAEGANSAAAAGRCAENARWFWASVRGTGAI